VTIRKTDAPRPGMAGFRAVFFVLGIMPGWFSKIRAALIEKLAAVTGRPERESGPADRDSRRRDRERRRACGLGHCRLYGRSSRPSRMLRRWPHVRSNEAVVDGVTDNNGVERWFYAGPWGS
jgi:hypothetical protein